MNKSQKLFNRTTHLVEVVEQARYDEKSIEETYYLALMNGLSSSLDTEVANYIASFICKTINQHPEYTIRKTIDLMQKPLKTKYGEEDMHKLIKVILRTNISICTAITINCHEDIVTNVYRQYAYDEIYAAAIEAKKQDLTDLFVFAFERALACGFGYQLALDGVCALTKLVKVEGNKIYLDGQVSDSLDYEKGICYEFDNLVDSAIFQYINICLGRFRYENDDVWFDIAFGDIPLNIVEH